MKLFQVAAIILLPITFAAPILDWEVIEEHNSIPRGWVKHESGPASDHVLNMKVHLKQQNVEAFEQKLLAVC